MSVVRYVILTFFLINSLAKGLEIALESNSSQITDGVFNFKTSKEFVAFPEVTYPELQIFCYNGTPMSVLNFWTSVEMRLKIESDDYHLYIGRNVTMVKNMHDDHMSSWFYQVLPWKTHMIKINAFEPSCIGVLARDAYHMSLMIKNVEYIYVLMTIGGVVLFYNARKLCRNVFFHYTTGVGVGIFLSLLVIIFFVQRRFNLWAGYVIVSYSLATYLLTSIWYNIKTYLVNHYTYVLGYLLLTGGASFAVCYRMGPVENPRTLNLIQWALQLFATALIFSSSYHQAASLSIVLLMLLWESTPAKWKTKIQVVYQLKVRKPKARILTEQEYLDQSQAETARALKELREHCKSPKCDPWKVTSRLQSPTRFAEFVAGSPHVTQEEILDYSQQDYQDSDEVDLNPPMTDDNSSDDEDDDDEIDLENPYE